jgi:putative nucleotidyltransferase with HDIG domain
VNIPNDRIGAPQGILFMKLGDYVTNHQKPPTFDEVIGRVSEISTLPSIAMQVMKVANDPDSGVIDMKSAIEMDPALSARVLRCVNASAYGLREKVSNVQRAISFLGMQQIRNLALTASVAGLFTQEESIGSYHRRDLWRHMVAVGISARLIAMRQSMPDFEDAFVAGLLHDIGIVLEDQYAHEQFRKVIHDLDDSTTLVEAERNRLGFDHARLGAKVAENWRFSETVNAAIGYHHNSVDYRGKEIMIVRCVEVANLICTLKGCSSVGRKLIRVSQAALSALSLTREHLSVLVHDVGGELAKNAALFNI